MLGLQWNAQVTVGDVLTFVGLLGGFISLRFVYLQLRAGTEQAKAGAEQAKISAEQARDAATAQRGRFLLDVIQRYFDDPEMLRLYDLINSDSFVFNPDKYWGSKDAAAVSRTLYYFDTVGFLVNMKLISLEDVAILKYRIDAFFESPAIEDVLHSYRESRSRTRSQEQYHELARDLYRQLQRFPSNVRGIG